MLKEVILLLWVCTPVAHDAPDGALPICRPEALTAVDRGPETHSVTCQALNTEAQKRWGAHPGRTEFPDFGSPIKCMALQVPESVSRLPKPE